MKNVMLRLPPDEHQAFKIAASAEGKTMNMVARDLIRDYIKSKLRAGALA